MTAYKVVKVISATRSPMNAKRWFLETDCGHGIWVTARGKPTAKSVHCSVCPELNGLT